VLPVCEASFIWAENLKGILREALQSKITSVIDKISLISKKKIHKRNTVVKLQLNVYSRWHNYHSIQCRKDIRKDSQLKLYNKATEWVGERFILCEHKEIVCDKAHAVLRPALPLLDHSERKHNSVCHVVYWEPCDWVLWFIKMLAEVMWDIFCGADKNTSIFPKLFSGLWARWNQSAQC
jgi:hypothetical protein